MLGFFLSPFGPEMFASKDRAGRLFSRQPAHSPQPFSVIILIQLEHKQMLLSQVILVVLQFRHL